MLDKTKPLGNIADDLLNRLNNLGDAPLLADVKDIVRAVLEASGIPTRTPRSLENRPDFAVWIAELEPYFGNPILIEVKREISTEMQAKYVVEQVLHYAYLSNVRAVIIFVSRMSPEVIELVSSYFNLYFFDLNDFLGRLHNESIGQIIRNERNARVHGRLS